MDFLILGVGIAAQKVKEKVADLKSPILLVPTAHDAPNPAPSSLVVDLASTSAYLTERVLYERHREWKMRAVSLWIRQTALIEAKARGFPECWAGQVDRKTIKATRAAILEAKWVEKRLTEALEWCDQRDKSRIPLRKVVVKSKNGRKTRPRPIHEGFPDSLLELPFPLPSAPSSRNLRLTIPIPPSIEENLEGQPPPLYTPDLDEKSGEMRLEHVRWDPSPSSVVAEVREVMS
ncbi:hypothetical protein JCM11491_003627 [Sporobolomyces phaffii]